MTDLYGVSAFPIRARPAGAEGPYVPNVAPDPAATAAPVAWAERFRRRHGAAPSGDALTGYTAGVVIGDAVDRVVKRGQRITRASVCDAIESTRLPDALAGPVSFGRDGDLEPPAVSIYRIRSGAFRLVETILAAVVEHPAAAR